MTSRTGSVAELRQELRDLDTQRKAMEDEITLLSERLNAPGQPGVSGSLLDKQGFPRDDIDVVQIRRDRHRLICLTNDQKALTDKLARLLGELHEAVRWAPLWLRRRDDRVSTSTSMAVPPPVPFALVDEVSGGSPAEAAGLQVGAPSCCVQVGAASSAGQSLLQAVAAVLAASEGRPVAARVLRQGAPLELSLTPLRWSGRGLLGCHLQPL
ncbi:hypothetical protein VOLCADRAFT_61851 [Volvox carteri f. nagariensis]|uniref:Nas2 N-terminal domain-containing protein n=1 Tax=Volvox carteri f. nagariensis TaxID=3068 RepID=D8TZV7_VOLCA|nr:uncharacterized protein VOLCADRAFT_61851 [Volvox carteri f. nagariensis]EFJ47083.1 hypothetical protein VOLCADRAFT_61851 [Volvox carteri f. nagariensis]|eukprot:XP_002951978.1 hypothetical protein VOLCADRAFT_61851 [Volvox carteri f. nagariensis]